MVTTAKEAHKKNLLALIVHYGEACAQKGRTDCLSILDLLDLIRRELYRDEILQELEEFVHAIQ